MFNKINERVMKKTYIKPSTEVVYINAGKLLAGSLFGKEYMGDDIQEGETVEGE